MPDLDSVREAEFAILWHQHEGSGLAITRHDYLDLDVDHREWLLERIPQQREAEAKALRAAVKRGRNR